MQRHFKLLNGDQIDKWRSNDLSNQYLSGADTFGDIVLSKSIKPMHVIFKGKGALAQYDNNVIAGGPIVNIYIVYKTSPKTINSNFVFKNCLFGAVNILVMVLALIQKENLHIQMEEMVKMLLFLELI